MKRKLVAVFLLAVSIYCAGCAGSHRKNESITDDYEYTYKYDTDGDREKNENEGDEVMAGYQMTQEQTELLCSISVNEDKVREGDLAEWQIEVLKQYDYAMEYLAEKYPSYEFAIVGCEPKNNGNSYTTFTFVEKEEESLYYNLYLDVYEEESANRYEATDNFYGTLYETQLAERMLELMQEKFPECVQVTTSITCAEDEKFGENFDLESVLNGEQKMEHDTDFYISAAGMTEAEYSQKVENIKSFIDGKGIYGSYDVKFIMESDPDDVLYREHFFGE